MCKPGKIATRADCWHEYEYTNTWQHKHKEKEHKHKHKHKKVGDGLSNKGLHKSCLPFWTSSAQCFLCAGQGNEEAPPSQVQQGARNQQRLGQ